MREREMGAEREEGREDGKGRGGRSIGAGIAQECRKRQQRNREIAGVQGRQIIAQPHTTAAAPAHTEAAEAAAAAGEKPAEAKPEEPKEDAVTQVRLSRAVADIY